MTKDNNKIRAYLYPLTKRLTTGVYNPYIDKFMDSTGSDIHYVNRAHPSNSGIFNLLGFLPYIDKVFLNWAEDIPEKTGGIMQSLFLLFLLKFRRLLGIKVVWTMHNKFSHSSKKLVLKKRLFKALLNRSDFILTHSKEGLSFAESILPGSSSKFFYYPHPVVPRKRHTSRPKKYDVLIWGTIAPYKGIDSFLAYMKEKNLLDKYRILITGKILSSEFHESIKIYEREKIKIENRFISNEELGELIGQSRIVLFTYSGSSVLSSGVLADSISYHASVLGPNVGAFAEMGEMGIIKTYDHFDQLVEILERIRENGNIPDHVKLEEFIHSHTWDHFGEALTNAMKKKGL